MSLNYAFQPLEQDEPRFASGRIKLTGCLQTRAERSTFVVAFQTAFQEFQEQLQGSAANYRNMSLVLLLVESN